MNHVTFESNYKSNFAVVEQRQGNLTLFPHTDQLPILHRALNLEFKGGLPGRLSRLDHRASDFEKLVLWHGAFVFCTLIHGARRDGLLLVGLRDSNFLTKLAIAQRVTMHSNMGDSHHFRYYTGDEPIQDIYLSGKRIAFSEHAMQRFCSRVTTNPGREQICFLSIMFESPMVAVEVNGGLAFVKRYKNAPLAFTYREAAKEFLITTCLSMNEINSFDGEGAHQAFNCHYGAEFQPPTVRNWDPISHVREVHQSWQARNNPLPLTKWPKNMSWLTAGSKLLDVARAVGHGPGSHSCFLDNIPGPCVLTRRANDPAF